MTLSIAIRYWWKTAPVDRTGLEFLGLDVYSSEEGHVATATIRVISLDNACYQPGECRAVPLRKNPRGYASWHQKSNREEHNPEAVWVACCPRRQVKPISDLCKFMSSQFLLNTLLEYCLLSKLLLSALIWGQAYNDLEESPLWGSLP